MQTYYRSKNNKVPLQYPLASLLCTVHLWLQNIDRFGMTQSIYHYSQSYKPS